MYGKKFNFQYLCLEKNVIQFLMLNIRLNRRQTVMNNYYIE